MELRVTRGSSSPTSSTGIVSLTGAEGIATVVLSVGAATGAAPTKEAAAEAAKRTKVEILTMLDTLSVKKVQWLEWEKQVCCCGLLAKNFFWAAFSSPFIKKGNPSSRQTKSYSGPKKKPEASR